MFPFSVPKVGRNDPCPCGSDKKYKKCHGGAAPVAVPKLGQIDARMKKLAPKASCLVPDGLHKDCSGKIIDSHTVSRSGSLGAIARDGHVYSYGFTLQHIDKMGGKLLPKLTGWKDASTFPGFCAHHDKELFAPLEDAPFTGSPHQCFLLAYRSIAWELYAKQRSTNVSDYRAILGASQNPFAELTMKAFNYANELGLRDVKAQKARYDKILQAEQWSECHGLLIEFDRIFPIQCAAAWSPEKNIDGTRLQHLGTSKKAPATATLASFAADGKSYFLLSWLDDSADVASSIADSIQALQPDQVPGVIAALLVQTSENCHFSPDWYESQSKAVKDWLEVQGNPMTPTKPPAAMGGSAYFSDIVVASTKRF